MDSLHKYVYVSNNPINFIDPSGNLAAEKVVVQRVPLTVIEGGKQAAGFSLFRKIIATLLGSGAVIGGVTIAKEVFDEQGIEGVPPPGQEPTPDPVPPRKNPAPQPSKKPRRVEKVDPTKEIGDPGPGSGNGGNGGNGGPGNGNQKPRDPLPPLLEDIFKDVRRFLDFMA